MLLLSCYVMSNSFATPWIAAQQGPLSMGSARQECCSGLPFPSLGDLPNPGIEPASPVLAGGFFTIEPPGKPKSVEANKEMRFGFKTDHSTYKAAEVKMLMGELSTIPGGSPGVIVQQ